LLFSHWQFLSRCLLSLKKAAHPPHPLSAIPRAIGAAITSGITMRPETHTPGVTTFRTAVRNNSSGFLKQHQDRIWRKRNHPRDERRFASIFAGE